MVGIAMDVLMEYRGCKFATVARRNVAVTASVGRGGGHAFSQNDVF